MIVFFVFINSRLPFWHELSTVIGTNSFTVLQEIALFRDSI